MAESTESSELKVSLDLINCVDYRSELTQIRQVGSADLRSITCKALLSKGYRRG